MPFICFDVTATVPYLFTLTTLITNYSRFKFCCPIDMLGADITLITYTPTLCDLFYSQRLNYSKIVCGPVTYIREICFRRRKSCLCSGFDQLLFVVYIIYSMRQSARATHRRSNSFISTKNVVYWYYQAYVCYDVPQKVCLIYRLL